MAMKVDNSPYYQKLPSIDLGFEGRSKVNSLDNVQYRPGGGNKQIINQKLKWNSQAKVGSLDDRHLQLKRPQSYHSDGTKDISAIKFPKIYQDRLNFTNARNGWEHLQHNEEGTYAMVKNKKYYAKPKVGSFDNVHHSPGGGDVKILSDRLEWQAGAKVGSLNNVTHEPGGGQVIIPTERIQWNAQSKVGSLDNRHFQPPGGNVQIHNEKLKWKPNSKVDAKNASYSPKGGDVKIVSEKLKWETHAKVGSLENAGYKPKTNDINIVNERLNWEVSPRIGSLDNVYHTPGGGNVTVRGERLQWQGNPKVGSMDNVHHVPGGGDKHIISETPHWDARPKIGSLEIAKTYKPGGGNIQIVNETPRWQAHPKIDSLGNVTHRAGGGNVQIVDNSLEWNTSAKVGSLDNVAHHAGGGSLKIPMKIWPYPKGSMDELPSPVTGRSRNPSRSSGVVRKLHGETKENCFVIGLKNGHIQSDLEHHTNEMESCPLGHQPSAEAKKGTQDKIDIDTQKLTFKETAKPRTDTGVAPGKSRPDSGIECEKTEASV